MLQQKSMAWKGAKMREQVSYWESKQLILGIIQQIYHSHLYVKIFKKSVSCQYTMLTGHIWHCS